jgi:hypothetical protein
VARARASGGLGLLAAAYLGVSCALFAHDPGLPAYLATHWAARRSP